MNQDQEHLRLLSIFHYVMAGLACLLPLFSLIYIGLGAAMLSGKMPSSSSSAHSDVISGWIFAGRALAKRERRTLCLVVAGLNCLHMPLGTLLGVFTLIVLGRPSVQALFDPTGRGAVPAVWPPVGSAPGYPPPANPPGTSPFSNQNP